MMIENLPGYVTITFILTTFATIGFFLSAVKKAGEDSYSGQVLVFLVSFWIFFPAVLAIGGFYSFADSVPPRIFLFGALPALLTTAVYLVFFRNSLISKLPLRTLTLLHIVRVPVEVVIYWLFLNGAMPRSMTFGGWNYDILSGITAPVVCWLAFRNGRVNRPLLIAWNAGCLVLLAVIVATAFFAFPSPLQRIDFDQPNRAVMFFPFIWLPALIVPIVFFSHLAALSQLFSKSR